MTDKTDTKKTPPRPRSSSNLLLWLLTWVALIAVASYTVWQKENADNIESAHMKSLVEALQKQEQITSTLSEIVEIHDEQFQQVAEHSNKLVTSIKTLNQQLNEDERTWRIVLVQSYIEQAVMQAGIMNDPSTAVKLLTAAQLQLKKIGDPKLSALDDAISSDKQMLMQAMPIDKSMIISALNTIINEVPKLPQKTSEQEKPAEEKQTKKESWQTAANNAWQELKSLVKIRKGGELLTPHISKSEHYLINENLQLILQQASFAALKGNQVVYTQQLQSAVDWLNKYYDANNDMVKKSIAILNNLKSEQVAVTKVTQQLQSAAQVQETQ